MLIDFRPGKRTAPRLFDAGRIAIDAVVQAIPNRARCSSHLAGRRVSPASFFAVSSSG